MKTDIVKSFGQRIKKIRLDRNLSQEEFADLTGFHRTYIGMIERGERNPSLKNIQKIAQAFHLSISELFKEL